jgi:hypothetical protein
LNEDVGLSCGGRELGEHNWRFEINDDLFQRVVSKQFGLDEDIEPGLGQLERYWMEQFRTAAASNKIHGSFDDCFENAAYKVRQLFIHTREMLGVEKKLLSIVDQAVDDPENVQFKDFGVNILVGHLLLRGCLHEKSIVDFAKRRIQAICETIRTYQYQIFVEQASTKAVPEAFRGQKIVHPDLTKTSLLPLPLIHDVLYFRVIANHFPDLRADIDTILAYILSEEYQRFPRGYGIGFFEKRYYAVGWSVTIPSFLNSKFSKDTLFNLIHLSHYQVVNNSNWFKSMLAQLSAYKRTEDTFEFPRNAVQEKKNTYFVGGSHLGVVGNRRLRNRNQMESTYWYNVIKKNMENAI